MLDADKRARLVELFAAGVELDAAARRAFAERACVGDPELLAELTRLLAIESGRLGDFLAEPAVAKPAAIPLAAGEPEDPPPPTPLPRIDGYTDFQVVAEGGMGTVYRAQQVHPVRRTVAIKLIRAGFDSGAVLARFEAERHALALMAHPNIATVHDAGRDALGRPFLAMEFVDGRPIHEFCEVAQLSLDERIDLLAKVCDAVEHAHRRGVLHRDLKPTNVLVSHGDDGPLPKVIDFGIAKALDEPLGDRAILTELGSFLGTPEYMSPEQLDGDTARIDTRADVYSLGVMLYQLVTGELPFAGDRLRAAGFAQMATMVRNETPPKPSTRVRARLATAIESRREATRVRWLHRLHGDLDWIAMKALEKDPDRRYASPRELAQDLRAYRTHMPVTAGPPSGLYRLRRFVRRNRLRVTAALLVLLSLVVGLCGTLWFLFESRANERAARTREREAVAALRAADGHRLASEAAILATTDPNLALLLALEASERTDSPAVAETLLEILPHHDLVGLFEQCDHDVREALFLPDGRLLLQVLEPAVLLVAADAGTLLHRFVGHTGAVTDIALSPSGERLLTVSADTTARLWDVATGACLHVVADHDDMIDCGEFAPDGRSFAIGGLDHRVQVHDVRTGARLHRLDAGGAVRSIAFSPDGRHLAVQPESAATRVFDLATGTVVVELPPPPGEVPPRFRRIAFGPGGDRLVRHDDPLAGDDRVEVFSIDGARLADLPGFGMLATHIDDPLWLDRFGGLARVSLATGELLDTRVIADLHTILEPAPDGRHAIGVDGREDLCIVDLDAARITRRLSGRSDKRRRHLGVAFHPDGERFVVTGSRVRMWPWTPAFAPLELPMNPHSVGVVSLVVTAEPRILLEHHAAPEPFWSLWDIAARRQLRILRPTDIVRLWLTSDGTRLFGIGPPTTTSSRERSTRVATFDLEGRLLSERTVDPGVGILPRPDGLQFAVGHDDRPGARTLRIHRADGGDPVTSFPVAPVVTHWSSGPAFSYLLQGWGSRTRTDVLDIGRGVPIASVRGPTGAGHYGVAVDEATKRLLIVLGDLRARVFDLGADLLRADAAPIAEYTDLVRSDAYHCGFAARGRLAWVLCANQVHLFDAATGARFAVLRLRSRGAMAAASADGNELMTVTIDGCCQRWPLDPLTVARHLARGELSSRQLEHYRIGTPAERAERTHRALRARPTPRNWALLGEAALRDGDLDEAIACYQRGCDLGPLAPEEGRRYLRLLELCCRRLAAMPPAERRDADVEQAMAALVEAVRCGVSAATVRSLHGVDALAGLPRFRQLVGE